MKPTIKPARWFLLWAAVVCCPSASAQLSLYTVQGGVETAVGQVYNVGAVAAGDSSDTQFRLKNTGTQLLYLTYLSVNGTGFMTPSQPQRPAQIPAGGSLDFTVPFQVEQPGSYSATLQLNDAPPEITTILFATAIPGIVPMLNNQPLASGQTLDFGNVKTGSTQTLTLRLANPNQIAALTVGSVAIEGSAFQLAVNPQGSTLAGGASVALSLVFAPAAGGEQQGMLTIGSLSFPLQGVGLAPPLPKPTIQLNVPTAASGQQGTLAVNLETASQSSGSGTVTLAFQPAVTGATGDPTITFSDGSLSTTFSVTQGASAAQFSSGPTVQFGTGTTAGTLTFTATLGSDTAQASVTVPGAAIAIDAAEGVRDVACVPADLYCTATNVEVQINGWDNTRTTRQIVYHFYDASGNSIAPGDITVDGSTAFQQYFAASTMGGVFGLYARFPVTGDSNQVAAVDLKITNSVGTTSSQRIEF